MRVASILGLSLTLPISRPPLSDAHIPSPYLRRRTPIVVLRDNGIGSTDPGEPLTYAWNFGIAAS